MRKSRSKKDHERYVRNRPKILEYQKEYRETHNTEIRERRRQKRIEERLAKPPKKLVTRAEINRAYYLAHREDILKKRREYYFIHRDEIL